MEDKLQTAQVLMQDQSLSIDHIVRRWLSYRSLTSSGELRQAASTPVWEKPARALAV